MLLDGTHVDRVIATFYTYTSGLLTAESGPCVVANLGVTNCPGGSPLVEYSYYAPSSGSNSGRLQTRTAHTGTTTLTTTYGDYTLFGEPGYVIDENGVQTDFTYEGHNVTSRTINIPGGGTAVYRFAVSW